uniref:Uncharacterized protein n=1 Tax=Arundo donax TaxID=35708 RepID=A0A0A9DF30_ARUDO
MCFSLCFALLRPASLGLHSVAACLVSLLFCMLWLARRVHRMQILVFFPDIDIRIQVRMDKKEHTRD